MAKNESTARLFSAIVGAATLVLPSFAVLYGAGVVGDGPLQIEATQQFIGNVVLPVSAAVAPLTAGLAYRDALHHGRAILLHRRLGAHQDLATPDVLAFIKRCPYQLGPRK